MEYTPPVDEKSATVYPSPPKPKKTINLNGNQITVLSVGLFIIFSLIIIAFLYYQNQKLKSMLINQSAASPSPTALARDTFSNWKIYQNSQAGYLFQIPQEWNQITSLPTADINQLVVFQSTDGLFRLSVNTEENLNKTTSKAFSSIDEYIGLPYQVKSYLVDGQEARQPLPRAGTDSTFKTFFFSKDLSRIISIELLVGDGTLTDHRVTSDSLEIGSDIFEKVLSTFKFFNSSPTPIATCVPRPSCLDTNPRCLIPETNDMCPAPSSTP